MLGVLNNTNVPPPLPCRTPVLTKPWPQAATVPAPTQLSTSFMPGVLNNTNVPPPPPLQDACAHHAMASIRQRERLCKAPCLQLDTDRLVPGRNRHVQVFGDTRQVLLGAVLSIANVNPQFAFSSSPQLLLALNPLDGHAAGSPLISCPSTQTPAPTLQPQVALPHNACLLPALTTTPCSWQPS